MIKILNILNLLFPNRYVRLTNTVALTALCLLGVQLGTLPVALQYLYYFAIAYEFGWFTYLAAKCCKGFSLLSGACGIIEALTFTNIAYVALSIDNQKHRGASIAIDIICLTIFSLVEQIIYNSFIIGPLLVALAQAVYVIASLNQLLCVQNQAFLEQTGVTISHDAENSTVRW